MVQNHPVSSSPAIINIRNKIVLACVIYQTLINLELKFGIQHLFTRPEYEQGKNIRHR